MIKNASHAWKEKKSNQNAILLGIKIIDWITYVINGSISLERFNETSLPDKIIFFIEI